ncbi:site-specific integrase [Flavobacterium sangjuense]|uniref:Tyrosine recombinase XerC n=1 Tax=Flavobacterium sangjuense TaxID=2518177 RepID=A0A4P7PX18_9FLAO|nr:site-specific integrase [Flavobacterium sangjuense]QBZ98852.1 Tyrosine recombinase XerC [Flavobacterium sangjuense]
MLKVFFYIKTDKVKANGEAPIYAKVTLGNQKTTLSTGKDISPERWMFTNKLRNVLKLEQEKVLKKSLELFSLNLNKKFNEIYEIDPNVDLSLLKDEISGKIKSRKSILILDIFEKHNTDFARKVNNDERAAASLQKYKRSSDLMKNFIKKTYGKENFEFDEVNGAFIHNLESYLKYESEFKGIIGIKNNSVVKYFTNFKTMINFGIKINLIDKNPFVKYEGKLKVRDATFLTTDELNLIESKTFSSIRLENVKNIFLFSCYTGYAPIDACSLKLSNLIQDNNGMFWIKTDRVKTGVRANVPVLPPAQKIIDKYKDSEVGLIPKLSNQKMNAYLKEIADLCGIEKNLTWYVARHTFATTVTLGNGIKIENVSAMMGHTNIKQTQHYAKVLDSSVMQDMHKLMEKFK